MCVPVFIQYQYVHVTKCTSHCGELCPRVYQCVCLHVSVRVSECDPESVSGLGHACVHGGVLCQLDLSLTGDIPGSSLVFIWVERAVGSRMCPAFGQGLT